VENALDTVVGRPLAFPRDSIERRRSELVPKGEATMSIYASWIDGTAVTPQREGYFLSKTMGGKGATFRTHTAPGSNGEWFQWAIPTPVIIDGHRVSSSKVFVLYATEGTAQIRAVHVYDSDLRIATFDGLHHSGNHSAEIDAANTWAVPSHVMKFGLGISVLVDFGPRSKVGVPAITFFSAGADFTL
jgi:hypothetical protein